MISGCFQGPLSAFMQPPSHWQVPPKIFGSSLIIRDEHNEVGYFALEAPYY
jgi:hypothetical protein